MHSRLPRGASDKFTSSLNSTISVLAVLKAVRQAQNFLLKIDRVHLHYWKDLQK